MNAIKKIAKNTFFLLPARISVLIFGFLYNIYAARYLGTEGFGILSFALAFNGIFGLLADMGLRPLTTRDVARDGSLAEKYLINVGILKIFLGILTLILIVLAINLTDYPKQTIKVVYIISISTVSIGFTQMFYSIFQAFEKMEYIAYGDVLNSSLTFFGAVIAIELGLNIVGFVSIYLIVNLTVLIYSILVCISKFVLPTIQVDMLFWKKLLKESMPFWLTSVFAIIYFRIDMVMLSMMKGDEITGLYAASYRLIDALSVFPATFMSIMYPVFSKYHLKSEEGLKLAFRKSIKFLIIIAIPIGIGTTILSEQIILLIYGNEYTGSIIALKILIWANVLCFINYTPVTLLNSIGKQRSLMTFTSVGAVLNIILNLLLIPKMSYAGAGIATVTTELIVGLLMLYQLQKIHRDFTNPLKLIIVKSVISGSIMGIVILSLNFITLFLLIPLAAIIYLIGLSLMKIFDEDDLNLLKQVIRR